MIDCYGSICTLTVLIFQFSKKKRFTLFFFLRVLFLSSKLFSFEFFTVSALSMQASPAGACCRADWPAAGWTARVAVAPAWVAVEARAAQVWPPRGMGGGGRPHRYHRFQLARLLAGLAVSPPMTYAISFLAATLVAFEVRCTPSPAQMLVPSTVVSFCKGGSSRPKNSSTFGILASAVLLPAVAASDRYFSDPDISHRKSGSWRLDTWLVSWQQATRTYLGSRTVSKTFASPVFEMMISTNLMVFLNAEGGGQAAGCHSGGTAHPLRISPPGWADRHHQYPGKLCLTWNRSQQCRFQSG